MPHILAQSDGEVDQTLNELSRLTATDWIVAGAIVVASIIVGVLARRLAVRSLRKRSGHLVANLIGRLAFALFLAVGIVYALNQVGVSIGPLLGLLGLLGLAFALAFQEVLGNFIAGVMLSLQRPFRVGDEIGTADYAGKVEDVSLRTVTLETFDGVRVHVPNSMVWEQPIENFTSLGSRSTTLTVGVSYGCDLDEASRVLVDAASEVEGVESDPAPRAYVEEFADSSINFSVMFWHDARIASEWSARDSVAKHIKKGLDTAGIDIPFPQVMVLSDQADSSAPAG